MIKESRVKEEAVSCWKEIHIPVLKQRTKGKSFPGRWPQRKPSVRINENWPWILLCWVHGPQISDSKISRMKHDTYKLDADCFIGKWKIDCHLPWLSERPVNSYFLEKKKKKAVQRVLATGLIALLVTGKKSMRAQPLTFSSSSLSQTF